MFKFGRGGKIRATISVLTGPVWPVCQTGLTDLNLGSLAVQKIGPSQPLRCFWINTRCLNKYKTINWKANKEGILHHQDQESINGHCIGTHHLFRRCMCHGMRIQIYPIIIHGLVIILGCHIMTISFMLYQGAMIWIIGRIGHFKIFVIEHAKSMKAEIVCWSWTINCYIH